MLHLWEQHGIQTTDQHFLQSTVKPQCTDMVVLEQKYRYIELSVHIGHS